MDCIYITIGTHIVPNIFMVAFKSCQ